MPSEYFSCRVFPQNLQLYVRQFCSRQVNCQLLRARSLQPFLYNFTPNLFLFFSLFSLLSVTTYFPCNISYTTVFFQSLVIFFRSKYFPLRVFILQIYFFLNTSLPQIYSLPAFSLSIAVFPNIYHAILFSQCISTTTILSSKVFTLRNCFSSSDRLQRFPSTVFHFSCNFISTSQEYLSSLELFISLFFSSFSQRLPPLHLPPLQP